MTNVVLLNLAVPGERREMFFFKDVLELNSVILKALMKHMLLPINAHKVLRPFQRIELQLLQ